MREKPGIKHTSNQWPRTDCDDGKLALTSSALTPRDMLPVLPISVTELPRVQLQDLNRAIKGGTILWNQVHSCWPIRMSQPTSTS